MRRKSRFHHVLKRNCRNAVPERCIYVDTETHPTEIEPGIIEQVFWFGHAQYRDYSGHTKEDEITFYNRGEFWEWVESKCVVKKKVYLFAHNTDFDFRVLQGFTYLHRLGFSLRNLIADQGKWISDHQRKTTNDNNSSVDREELNHKPECSICVLDSMNWFKTSLSVLGKTLNLEKLPMPEIDASREEWESYCRRDVEILRLSVESLIRFIKEEDMGNFAYTLAKQAMNAFRHRFMKHEIVIHTKPDVIELERSSYCGGRTEAFFIGRLPQQTYYKLDINSQYPYVMANESFPRMLLGIRIVEIDRWLEKPVPDETFLADCTVTTDVPNIPYRYNHRLCFPIGTMRAVLCEPEYRLAKRTAKFVHVHRIIVYKASRLFEEWVTCLYDLRKSYKQTGNDQYQFFCKLLMNSLYGKFGQRSEEWIPVDECEPSDSWYRTLIDFNSGKERTLKAVGGVIWERTGKKEGWDTLVSIASFVTSYARAYLWTLMEQAGRENVFYCDTDSLIVNQTGRENLSCRIDPDRLGWLKEESISEDFIIRNLKDYTFGEETKIKGINRNAVQIGDNVFLVDEWEHLLGSIHRDRPETVMVRRKQKVLQRVYNKGTVSEDGTVKPFIIHSSLSDTV